MSADFIRVKARDTGHEFSIREDIFDDEIYELLDKPALGLDGEVLPAKPHTTVAKQATAKKPANKAADTGHQADTEKE